MMINFNYLNNSRDEILINPVSRPIGSFDEEIVKHSIFIKDHSDKKIIVALSGGIDSELACIGFLKANIPFEAVTVEYSQGRNSYDVNFAKKFCKENNIKHHVLSVEPENFYTDIKEKYLRQNIKAHSIYRYFQTFLIDWIHEMNGTPVFCAGDQQFKVINGVIHIKYAPVHIFENWMNERNIMGFPFYFLGSPEIQAGYLLDPLIQFLLRDIKYFVNEPPASHCVEKLLIYHKHFDMQRRKKMIGFEQIMPLKKELEVDLVQYYGNSQDFTKPVADALKELGT